VIFLFASVGSKGNSLLLLLLPLGVAPSHSWCACVANVE
jgi:hypothetical protein